MNQIIYLTINFCCIPYKLVCYITGEYIENNFFFFKAKVHQHKSQVQENVIVQVKD